MSGLESRESYRICGVLRHLGQETSERCHTFAWTRSAAGFVVRALAAVTDLDVLRRSAIRQLAERLSRGFAAAVAGSDCIVGASGAIGVGYLTSRIAEGRAGVGAGIGCGSLSMFTLRGMAVQTARSTTVVGS